MAEKILNYTTILQEVPYGTDKKSKLNKEQENQECNGTVFESTGNDVTQKYMYIQYGTCRRKRIFPSKRIRYKNNI